MHIHVIDSHTGGEPTRVITAGGPDLGSGNMAERRDRFRQQFDHIRSAAVNEPRASDAVVGALLCEPQDPAHAAGVIFFNNVGFIGMCGHGTIGLLVTLAHMGRISPGVHTIETVVGNVTAELHKAPNANEVSVRNVPSYRLAKAVSVPVEGHGSVVGDIAWGGNWFFLVDHGANELRLEDLDRLTDFTWRIRRALVREGITGANGAEIDHIELFTSAAMHADSNSRNFVLCPGGAYDRSPCGTGTSAKLACLAADRKLAEGELWRQEGIVGGVFAAQYWHGEPTAQAVVHPTIRGSAFVTAEADLILDERDPFRWGIRW